MRINRFLRQTEGFYKNTTSFSISAWNKDNRSDSLSAENKTTLWKLTRTLPVKLQERVSFLAVVDTPVKYAIPTVLFLHKHGMNANVSGHAHFGAAPSYFSTIKATVVCTDKIILSALKTMFQDYVLDHEAKDLILKVPESDKKKFEMFLKNALSLVKDYSFNPEHITYESYEEPPRPLSSLFAM